MATGNIVFHHPSSALSNTICLFSDGNASNLRTGNCGAAAGNSRYQFWFSADVTNDQKENYQGIMSNNMYWGSDIESVQCIYVSQKGHILYVATCRDMNYSFGNDPALFGGVATYSESAVKTTDPWTAAAPEPTNASCMMQNEFMYGNLWAPGGPPHGEIYYDRDAYYWKEQYICDNGTPVLFIYNGNECVDVNNCPGGTGKWAGYCEDWMVGCRE